MPNPVRSGGRRVRVVRVRRTGPSLLPWLVGANVVVFLAWNLLRDQAGAVGFLTRNFLVSSASVSEGRWWTLLTSEFSHVDAMHLLFNLLALWTFGRDVEGMLGRWRFLSIYLVGAAVASIGHVVFGVLTGDGTPALGASGAVMAVAVLFGAFFPTRTLIVMFVPMPAALGVAVYVALDLLGVARGGGQVAHAAHLGGALVGASYAFALRGGGGGGRAG